MMPGKNGHNKKAKLFKGGGSKQAKGSQKRIAQTILRKMRRKRQN